MGKNWTEETKKIMAERFGHDSLIALATVKGDRPSVRTVDGYYEDGAFYVITYALSNKMKDIEANPNVAVSGEWFSGHGIGENLGWFCKKENTEVANTLRKAFEAWIDNGHNNFDDENTCILKIRLTDGMLVADGKWYGIEF